MHAFILMLIAASAAIAVSTPASASAKSFTCKHEFSPTINEVVVFKSGSPLLQKTVTFLKDDGSLDAAETKVFVSATSACGATLDFEKQCKASSEDSADGYRFSFTCAKDSIRGRLYMYPNGYGAFSCNDGVGTQFFDCKSSAN